jgi:UPF0176 protein
MAEAANSSPIVVAALYKFVHLPDFHALRPALLDCAEAAGIKGTLLLAEEGINGTISGSRAGIDAVLGWLRADPRMATLEHKESLTDRHPFYRLKVKLKKEIVTLGVPEVDPNTLVGTYVDAQDWNALISDPEVLVLDTRNDYEVETGTFRRAIDPKTTSFREFPQFVREHFNPEQHKKVAMFCTGGIRCEKASSFMLGEGYAEVYHLKGGILKYLEEVPAEESLWQGECFVFDHRVGVTHGLQEGEAELCFGCRRPVKPEDRLSPLYAEGICCPYCHDRLTEDQKARFAERHKQIELAKQRQVVHMGAVLGRHPES